MEYEEIITGILYKLDGWVLDDESSAELRSSEYNKKVKADELIHFYNLARDYACSYTQRDNIDEVTVSETALILWASGLVWNKYDVRVNNQLDETNTLGYGDKLIVQAKEILKPYKSYSFQAY